MNGITQHAPPDLSHAHSTQDVAQEHYLVGITTGGEGGSTCSVMTTQIIYLHQNPMSIDSWERWSTSHRSQGAARYEIHCRSPEEEDYMGHPINKPQTKKIMPDAVILATRD